MLPYLKVTVPVTERLIVYALADIAIAKILFVKPLDCAEKVCRKKIGKIYRLTARYTVNMFTV